MRWELTFLPFLFQLTLGLGSPVAWHTNETTPPETPIWSTGTLVNRGGTAERTDKEEDIRTWQEEERTALLQPVPRGRAHSHGPAEENLRAPPYCRDPLEIYLSDLLRLFVRKPS